MSYFRSYVTVIVSALVLSTPAGFAASVEDARFFQQVNGQWSGPGEIVAGKYKGTKFVCNFAGGSPSGKVGMFLDGGCRVGMFTQEMSARVERTGKTYHGKFLDGAAGEGLDVIGGSVRGSKAVFSIHRNKLRGAMSAHMVDKNKMNVTISVHVNDELVPVIGMTLNRQSSRVASGK